MATATASADPSGLSARGPVSPDGEAAASRPGARGRDRGWIKEAMDALRRDAARSGLSPLIRFPLEAFPHIDLYLKDESAQPTGSLKHHLARSLYVYGICNGRIGASTTVVEASSGSTAVSEAYFAELLGLEFIAVVPASTSKTKISMIEANGGRCELVAPGESITEVARRMASECDGHFMDQFTFAERALSWREGSNLAASIFSQMAHERYPVPTWFVAGAGTGGTSATLGRHIRYRGYESKVCVPDPEGSAYFDAWRYADAAQTAAGSAIEGIGRPQVEPSFTPDVIDRMIRVTNQCSVGAMRVTGGIIGRLVGPSTGTNMWAAFSLAAQMSRAGKQGSIVTILCDGGERYLDTYQNAEWVASQGWDDGEAVQAISAFLDTGRWSGNDFD